MRHMTRTAALLAATLSLAIVLGVGCGGGGSTANEMQPPGVGAYRGSEPPPGLHLPSFALSDVMTREVVRSADMRGNVVLVTFLDSDCHHQCPIIAGQIGQALERLPASARERTRALVISVNPLVDTRASVKRFLRKHRVLGRLHYLSGSVAALRPVWKDFGVVSAYETGDVDTHSADVRVFDPAGVWVSTQHVGVDLTPANLARDVVTALESGA
jgi:cytochrome oxidase Cu insertion factor (SCO1/SenC/PrrC family)